MKEKIGFIGLGIMGKPMTKNLINAGYDLTIFNRSKKAITELVQLGAIAVQSPRDVAEKSDIIITMLPDSNDVTDVVLNENGIIEGIQKNSVLIDMSSIAPLVSIDIAQKIRAAGAEMLDAPVSGGEPGAIAASLAIMVGGSENVYKRCENILKTMGRSVVLVGPVGAGGFAKLANQIIVALNIAALGEAFSLAAKAGLDTVTLYNAIHAGLAGSNAMDAKIPMILDRNFNPGFKIKLHQKDLKNVMRTAEEMHLPLPLTSIAQQMLASLIDEEKGELDHSAIVMFQEHIAHLKIE